MASLPSGLQFNVDFTVSGHINCAYLSGITIPTSGYITINPWGVVEGNYHGVYTSYKCWNCSKFFRPMSPMAGLWQGQIDCPHCGQKG